MRQIHWRLCQLLLLALVFKQPVRSATNDEFEFWNYEKLTLEQSLNLKTTVGTKSPLSARESPDIVTIVTGEEIHNSGARNLLDVLRLVPGFELGLDIQGIVGIGFRGIWGQEGKILVLVDGQMYNDLGYAGTQIDRIPAAQIKRLEVIRGPGSVIYGGNAEVAVINIITRDYDDKGMQVTGLTGVTSKGGDQNAVDVHYGAGAPDGWRITAAAHYEQTERGDRPYTDVNGDSYLMRKNSDLMTKSVNVGVKKAGFHTRLIIDDFFTKQRDAFGVNQPAPTHIDSHLYLGEAGYDFKVGEKWTISPRFNFNQHWPWSEHDDFFLYDKKFTRYSENLTTQYNYSRNLGLLGGAELQQDYARVSEDTPDTQLWPGNRRSIDYNNQAYFAQGQFGLPFGTVVAGGRYEYHNSYKGSFVPRFAWTNLWNRFHMKAIFSEAFRTPSLENIRLNQDIRPERLTTYEVETGYQFLDDLFASVALFDMRIRKPIVYHNDPVLGTEFYSNDSPISTRGFEVTGRWKRKENYLDASYSFYSAHRRIPTYTVPNDNDALLGWPSHKVALNSNLALGRGYSLDPSAVLLIQRHGYDALDSAGNVYVRRFSDVVLVNCFVRKKDFFLERLELTLGVSDLLNSNYRFIQPYNSGHVPLPGMSREYSLRANYSF